MTPDESRAALGVGTNLLQHLVPDGKEPTNTPPLEPPTNQETGEDVKTQMEGLESRIMDEIGTLKEEIQKAQPKDSSKEINELKQQIEQVLNGD